MTPAEFTAITLKSQAANLGDTLRERFEILLRHHPEISSAAITDVINIAIDMYAQGVQDGTDHANDILNLITRGRQ
jgi:hypothetical protein